MGDPGSEQRSGQVPGDFRTPARLSRPYVLRDAGRRIPQARQPEAPQHRHAPDRDADNPAGQSAAWHALVEARPPDAGWAATFHRPPPTRHRAGPGRAAPASAADGILGPWRRSRRKVAAAAGAVLVVGILITALRLHDSAVSPGYGADVADGTRPGPAGSALGPGPAASLPGGQPGASGQPAASADGSPGPGNLPGVDPAATATPGAGPPGTAGGTPPANGRPAIPPPATRPAATRPPAATTAPAGPVRSAYAHIEAESFTSRSGTTTGSDPAASGGRYLGSTAAGDWLRFDNVDFTGTAPRAFTARVSSAVTSDVPPRLQVRIDRRDSAPVVDARVGNTGGWHSYVALAASTTVPTGRHTLFVCFAGDRSTDLMHLDWIMFNGPHG